MFRKKGRTRLISNYIILLLLACFALGPILVPFLNSLKTPQDLGTNPIGLPRKVHIENYTEAWVQGEFATTLTNSLIYVIFTVSGVLLLGGMAAYSLARLDPPGGDFYLVYMLTLSTLPFWLYVIPLFILWKNLSLLDTRFGLIIMYIAFNSPFAIFLLRSFFVSLFLRQSAT